MECRIIFLIAILTVMVGTSVSGLAKPQWPEKCKARPYCPIKPKNYPQTHIDNLVQDHPLQFRQYIAELKDRDGSETDVGDCRSFKLYRKLYLIKDQNDEPRYVAQSANFTVMVQIEECRNPGKQSNSVYLDTSRLEEDELHCYETRIPLSLPVLALDGSTLESATPKGGVSVSCSTKLIMKRTKSNEYSVS